MAGERAVFGQKSIFKGRNGSVPGQKGAFRGGEGAVSGQKGAFMDGDRGAPTGKVGMPNFVSGPREYIMEGAWVELLWQSWWDKSDIG